MPPWRRLCHLQAAPPGGDASDLGGIVADVDQRHVRFIPQAFQIRQDLALARIVKRSERLIEQQEARLHQQRTADCDALAFAAGQLAGPPIQQMADIKQVDHMSECGRISRLTVHPAAIGEIVLHRKVREQAAFLKNVADPPLRNRHINTRGAVKQHLAIENDAAVVGLEQAGNHIDDAGLAGTGRTEQGGGATFAGERCVDRNSPSCFATCTTIMAIPRAGGRWHAARAIPKSSRHQER